jgi:hypothetical protein
MEKDCEYLKDLEMDVDEAQIRVLYIMGYGHSGSTFIDTVLGNHQDIESVGELSNLHRDAWQDGKLCACGQRGNICPFWSKIRQTWTRRCGVEDINGYLELQQTFDNWKSPICWYRLIKQGEKPLLRFRIYGERTRALYKAISQVSGKSLIVDSSKSPARALVLSMIKGLDFRLIHLGAALLR